MGWNDVENNGIGEEKVSYTKFAEGTTKIRIVDDEPYSFWQHWLPEQRTSVTCLGKDCPICNVIKKDKSNGMTPRFNSSQRHAIRIWNYSTNQMEVMIQSKTFMSNLLTLHKEMGDLKGYDVKVIRKGTGTDTTYNLLPVMPATEFEFEEQLKHVDIPDLFKEPTKEEMLQLMDGRTWAEINGEEE